jgi:hypothetical protein
MKIVTFNNGDAAYDLLYASATVPTMRHVVLCESCLYRFAWRYQGESGLMCPRCLDLQPTDAMIKAWTEECKAP